MISFILMAYGTPRSREEILPYYTDIRRGRPPTDELLAELTGRYEAIGGLSPLAALTEAQRDAIQRALDNAAPGRFRVSLGLKHAHPMIEEAVADVATTGTEKIIGLVLAPHYSTYSIGQYVGRATTAA
ncbi:MAG: ferrochelatase, partial [Actinomycetota bacterium]